MATQSSTPGSRLRNSPIAKGMIVAAAEEIVDILSRPDWSPSSSPNSSSASWSRVRIPSAWRTSSSPASVRRAPPGWRSSRVVPRLALEQRDLAGDGGLGVTHRVRRGRERALTADLVKHSQPPRVQHNQKLYQTHDITI